MTAKITVVITNFNYARYLGEAIESVLSQDHSNIQLIVVDDGSTDNSAEIVSKYASLVTYVKKVNGGVSSARNAGMEIAEGDYVAFLDADDYWENSMLSSQLSTLVDTGAELSYCRLRIFDEQIDHQSTSTESRSGNFQSIYLSSPGKTPFPPSSVLMTSELISKAGDWDTNLLRAAEDFDFFRRCSKFTDFVFTDLILVNHRDHGSSLTSGPVELYFEDNQRAIIKMLKDDFYDIALRKKLKILIKFKLSFFKAFLKQRKIFGAIKIIIFNWVIVERLSI